MTMQTVKRRRDHVILKNVQAGRNGQYGAHVLPHVRNQANQIRQRNDTDVGIQKAIPELIVEQEKMIQHDTNHSHVNVIPKIYTKGFVNGALGVIGLNAILTVMRV